ncbi:MAG: DUF3303 family protein [Planctomycetota bacterium]
MRFMVVFQMRPEHRPAAVTRFMDGGAPPPEGIEVLHRAHAANCNKGFCFIETDKAEAIATWCHEWGGILTFEVYPVIEDESAQKIFVS